MSSVGIVCAKAHSKRFPNKNIHEVGGVPMFWHSVQPLLDSERIDKVYVSTDSQRIKSYCEERGVDVVMRTANAAWDEEPLLGVLRYTYKSLPQRYENIVTIMANCPGHTAAAVNDAVDRMNAGHCNEIRSFNNKGEESGLMVFKEQVVLNHLQISSHIGCVRSDVTEIHYQEDL